MVGVSVGTMALIVVLSVFNGLEDLLRSLYDTFDPELKVVARTGKSFEVNGDFIHKINAVPGVQVVSEVIEDNALVKYKEAQMVVRVKGVSDSFLKQGRLDRSMVQGELLLLKDNVPFAIIGRGVQYTLSIPLNHHEFNALQVFSPKNVVPGTMNPSRLFNQRNILIGGVFAIEKQYDENFIFVPMEFAQQLFEYDNKRTSLEVKLTDDANLERVRREIEARLGGNFKLLTSAEQHSDLYKLLRWEKIFVFITFAFILAIASFNIFFSLSMLAIDKRPDMAILNAMGANELLIKRIFIVEGAIIAFIGATVGLLLGLAVCLAQDHFGLVSMGMSTSIIDAYPVKMQVWDFISTGLLIFIITFLASYRPATLAANSLNVRHVH